MPRKPRVIVEGGIYHVYNRFGSGEAVFADPGSRRRRTYRANAKQAGGRHEAVDSCSREGAVGRENE